MSAEITYTTTIRYEKGFLKDNFGVTSLSIDMSGTRDHKVVQNVGTSVEAVVMNADISTPGLFFFRNTDATNYVEVGVTTTGLVGGTFIPVWKLKPGEPASGRLSPAVALFAKANTAAVDLEVRVVQD